MPVETGTPHLDRPASVGQAFLTESRHSLRGSLAKIAHCLDQLADEDVWWRPFETANSIENILLHLSGNVRQWIGDALAGRPDLRDRAAEFAERRQIPKEKLLDTLRGTLDDADQALAAFSESRLLEPMRVQGFDISPLVAIYDAVSHFAGHTQQIVYITRLRLGDKYTFQWTPTKEQGG